ncbi:MAG: SDR family oxidoreductase [Caldilineaceae bacterium]
MCVRSRAEDTTAQIHDFGGEALAVDADVSAARTVEAMAQTVTAHWGRVDILVNNAAISQGDDVKRHRRGNCGIATWPWCSRERFSAPNR